VGKLWEMQGHAGTSGEYGGIQRKQGIKGKYRGIEKNIWEYRIIKKTNG
jgi:hypothetical protein